MTHFTADSPYIWQPEAEEAIARGPLNDLRVAVKDLFHIAGVPTSAGNRDWLSSHAIPSTTSSSVQKLQDAGAVICGKTITDELAYSLNGQNVHYGTPLNPVTPDRLPGGSSSGSAVAVSEGSAEIGLGTDTGGSIRVPSSYNGLYGLRPTHGLIACDNMVELAPSFDTVGWMTRDIDTLSKVADCLLPQQAVTDTRPKIGHAIALTALAQHQDQIAQWLENRDVEAIADMDPVALHASDAFRFLQGAEIWQQHGDWLSESKRHIADDIAVRFEWCKTISEADIALAKQRQQDVIACMQAVFEKVDVVVLPTTPGASPLLTTPDAELADYRNRLLGMTAFAGLAGLPQLHLPLFTLNGAPCGLSLLGPKGSDKQLIAWAKQLVE